MMPGAMQSRPARGGSRIDDNPKLAFRSPPFKRDHAAEIRARFIDCARFQAAWSRDFGLPEEVLEWARLVDKAETWGLR